MDTNKKTLGKEELKRKVDTLKDEIRYRVSEAKKNEGNGIGSAHKTDIGGLLKEFRRIKEAYDRLLKTEQESLQLEDILASLSEEKEEAPDKVKEREELHKSRIEMFSELTTLVMQIKSILPKAKRQTEQYYKKNPTSFAVVFPLDEIKVELEGILEKLTGKESE
jgi:MoxR-like ATPase